MSLFIVGPMRHRVTAIGRSPRSINELAIAVTRYVNKHRVVPLRVSFTVWAPDARTLYNEALESVIERRGFLHASAPLFVHDLVSIGRGGALIVLAQGAPEMPVLSRAKA